MSKDKIASPKVRGQKVTARHLILTIILLFPAASQADQTDLLFPYEWLGNIDKFGFNEPSGIVYHEESRNSIPGP